MWTQASQATHFMAVFHTSQIPVQAHIGLSSSVCNDRVRSSGSTVDRPARSRTMHRASRSAQSSDDEPQVIDDDSDANYIDSDDDHNDETGQQDVPNNVCNYNSWNGDLYSNTIRSLCFSHLQKSKIR
jgi:hypothetical protein